MKNVLFSALLVVLTVWPVRAEPKIPVHTRSKGTYLGALFRPLTQTLQRKWAKVLPEDAGVMITFVLPNSPAERADLEPGDILLRYGKVSVRDCAHLAQLIQTDKPNRKVQLALFRAGKSLKKTVTLTLGPRTVLVPRDSTSSAKETGDAPDPSRDKKAIPRGIAKPGKPPEVSVTVVPLSATEMKVTIEYYDTRTGRFQLVRCQGGDKALQEVLKELPDRSRNLAQLALKRIRELTLRDQSSP